MSYTSRIRNRLTTPFSIALIGLVPTSLLGASAPAGASFPGQNGKIVLSGQCPDGYCIKKMDPSGSQIVNLTHNDRFNEHPKVSPSGKLIVFEGDDEMFIMRMDGSHLHRVLDAGEQGDDPTWSHNGKWIVFGGDFQGPTDIYKVHPDGTSLKRLTRDSAYDAEPDVSKDGLIAWKSARAGSVAGNDIWVMNLDGSNKHNLTENKNGDQAPSWSPNGNNLAYASSTSGDSDIWRIQANGNGATNLTDEVEWDSSWEDGPSWSPNGDSIVFDSTHSGPREIWKMTGSGGGQNMITDVDKQLGDCSWARKP